MYFKKKMEYDIIPIKKKSNKFLLIYILLILFVSISLYNFGKIIIYFKGVISNQKITEEVSSYIDTNDITNIDTTNNIDTNNVNIDESKTNYNIDFASLKEINNDIVSFIKINGTNIEYLVVKGNDNSYYLTHDLNKKYSYLGWIFMDYENSLDQMDKNIVIYGHNTKNGKMFGTLKNIFKYEWYSNDENRYITYITPNGESVYEVFSIYEILSEDYYRTIKFENDEYEKFLNTIVSRSKYDFHVEVKPSDYILTLSTCGEDNRYRVILHAKKLSD